MQWPRLRVEPRRLVIIRCLLGCLRPLKEVCLRCRRLIADEPRGRCGRLDDLTSGAREVLSLETLGRGESAI